jgi:hypothetical protein
VAQHCCEEMNEDVGEVDVQQVVVVQAVSLNSITSVSESIWGKNCVSKHEDLLLRKYTNHR